MVIANPRCTPAFLIFYTYSPVSAGNNYISFLDILAIAVKAVIFLDCPRQFRSKGLKGWPTEQRTNHNLEAAAMELEIEANWLPRWDGSTFACRLKTYIFWIIFYTDYLGDFWQTRIEHLLYASLFSVLQIGKIVKLAPLLPCT